MGGATGRPAVSIAPVRKKILSLVVPVLNEVNAVQPFLARTVPILASAAKLTGAEGDYEIIFVDDGSTDATPLALAAARAVDQRLRVVTLSRNFGKDAALAAGLRHARGDAVVCIDVDLQDPPEAIPKLVERWLAGAKLVTAVRSDRSRDSRWKRFTAGAFYAVYNRMAEQPIEPHAGDFRLLDRQVVDILNQLPERTRFMKGLFSWVGFPSETVAVIRAKRSAGSSNWSYWRLWNFALSGITTSTMVPLRLWSYCGGAIAAGAFLYALFIIARTLLVGRDVPGYASLMCAVLFVGGVNLLSLGILGEYIGRIFNEVKGRPLYVVRSTAGFDPPDRDEAVPGDA